MSIPIASDRGHVNKTSITIPFILAFISLRHLFHELHEFAHMVAGRLFCGTWGTRDFNNVHPITATCDSSAIMGVVVGLAGPMVNYTATWIGAAIIRNAKNSADTSIGLVLIFCSLPIARLVTALFGGGDEIGVARIFITNPLVARLVVIVLIVSILFYPLLLATKTLSRQSHGTWHFVGFLFIPMFIEGLGVLLFCNYLLSEGLLNTPSYVGAPLLVIVVLLVAFLVFFLFRKHLSTGVIKQPVRSAGITNFQEGINVSLHQKT